MRHMRVGRQRLRVGEKLIRLTTGTTFPRHAAGGAHPAEDMRDVALPLSPLPAFFLTDARWDRKPSNGYRRGCGDAPRSTRYRRETMHSTEAN